jgi:hypothetical protein
MSKRFGQILYRGETIASSKSGYYLKTCEHPTTLLGFSTLEAAKNQVDIMVDESDRDILDGVELRLSISRVVNDPVLLARLTERDEEAAKKVVQVARLCGLLKEATSL